jgi:prophage regulatory protein
MEQHAVSSTLETLPSTGFIRQAQLIQAFVPFSAATLWRRVRSGDFPKPVKLSDRVTAWRVEDVRDWIERRSSAAGRK